MKETHPISDKKILKLAKRVAKSFALTQEEALEIIYKEWDTVETLFYQHKKVKEVHHHLIDELGCAYGIGR